MRVGESLASLSVKERSCAFQSTTAAGKMAATSNSMKPHAVVIPYPGVGHIHPMMELSRRLDSMGFRVTFVCTQIWCERILQGRGRVGIVWGEEQGQEQGGIRLEGISDGLPDDFDREVPSVERVRAYDNLGGVCRDLLHRLVSRDHSPINCLISDSFLPWTQDVANEFGIPRVFFWTQSVSVFTIFASTHLLLASGFNPFEDNLNTADGMIDYIPGIPPLQATHLPYRTAPAEGSVDRRFLLRDSLENQFRTPQEHAWIIANSFDDLESQALSTLRAREGPQILLIGPLLPAPCLDVAKNPVEVANSECLQWLDTQAASSVLYICFGTTVTLSSMQLQEIAMGLIASQKPFLWVIRSDNPSEMLPEGFLEDTGELGMIMKWAPQLQVLGHPAVGGFMTHCGWNSTMEGICMGVPLLAWPHFLDQFTNCWFIVHEWKVGLELRRGEDGSVERVEVERAVRLVMQDEGEGREIRTRAAKLRDAARKAALPGGSSHANLQLFMEELMNKALS